MKMFTFFFLLFTSTTAFTQIRKGQYLLGGGLNFESTREERRLINQTSKSNDFFISPSFGYFIFDKIAGGLRMNISLYNTKTDFIETNTIATSLSPFLRYYVLPVAQKVNAFIDIAYLQSKSKWSTPANPGYYRKSKGYNISAGPSIFLTKQIALEFAFGFKHTNSDDFEETRSNEFSSGFGLQVHLGKNRKSRSPKNSS